MAEVVKQDPFSSHIVRLDRESLNALKSKDIQLVQQVSGRLPTLFDGKPFPFQCGTSTTYEFTFLQVNAPALIRLDYMPDSAGAFKTSPRFETLEVIAASRKFVNSLGALGTANYGGHPMLRGVGPLIYLPSEGEYGIGVKGTYQGGVVQIMGSILEGIDPQVAAAYLQGQVLHRNLVLPREVLALATTQVIPSNANLLAARGYNGRFGAGYMRIVNVGANPCNIAVGYEADVANGQLLVANGTRFISWQELIGCTVTAYSDLGTTLDLEMRTL